MLDLYLPDAPKRGLPSLNKELDERRSGIFKAMCESTGKTPQQLAELSLADLHALAERVTKLVIPDPQKIHACLIEYINGIENS